MILKDLNTTDSQLEWARKEVEIACADEKYDTPHSYAYIWESYKAALALYEHYIENTRDKVIFNEKAVKHNLCNLLNGIPLTPIIEDTDIWEREPALDDYLKKEVYRCKRYNRLFKLIDKDGSVSYSDFNRYKLIIDGWKRECFYSDVCELVLDELFPITLPYEVGNGEYDVFANARVLCKEDKITRLIYVDFIITPKKEKIKINRYFVSIENDEYGRYREINKDEVAKLI